MSAKIQIIQVTADGEQVSVEYNMDKRDYDAMLPKRVRNTDSSAPQGYRDEIIPGATLRQLLDPYFKLLDDRKFEINKRVQVANYYQKKLAKLSPEAFQLVGEIWDILHGRRQQAALDEVLEQDRLEREKALAELQAKQPTENPLQPETKTVEEQL